MSGSNLNICSGRLSVVISRHLLVCFELVFFFYFLQDMDAALFKFGHQPDSKQAHKALLPGEIKYRKLRLIWNCQRNILTKVPSKHY